jgi:16S rRNA processing protein RimM
MTEKPAQPVILGKITGLYGVRGWVKVYSHTEPRANIVKYSPWLIRKPGADWQEITVRSGKAHGKGVVAQLQGVNDRDQAAQLMGAEIAVPRSQLPAAAEGEYYWADLVGLHVVNLEGVELGKVSHLMETGANDVLVVKGERERLIPFLQPDVVTEVDLDTGRIQVDWDPEF